MILRRSVIPFIQNHTKASIVALIVVVYGLLGFLLAPYLAKRAVVNAARKHLDGSISIERFAVNPFVLSAEISGFSLKRNDGTPVASFERFYANFQLSSLLRRAITFAELSLVKPVITVAIDKSGNSNFHDLVNSPEDQPAADAEKPKTSNDLPRFIVGDVFIAGGTFTLTDDSLPIPYRKTLTPIDLSLRNFRTLPDSEASYRITATTGDNDLYEWNGQIAVAPFKSRGRIHLQNVLPRNAWEYLQHQLNFEVKDGKIDLDIDYDIAVKNDEPVYRLTQGRLTIKNMELSEKGAVNELIRIPEISLENIRLDSETSVLAIERVATANGKLITWLDESARSNYQSLFSFNRQTATRKPTDTAPAAEDERQPFVVNIGTITLADYAVEFEDRAAEPRVQLKLSPLQVRINDFSTRTDSRFDLELDTTVNAEGRIALDGVIVPKPAAAELDIQIAGLPLDAYNGYLNKFTNVGLQKGRLDMNGRITIDAGQGPIRVSLRTDAAVNDFAAIDSRRDRFLQWDSLSLKNLQLESLSRQVGVETIRFSRPVVHLVVDKQKNLNLAGLIKPADDSPQPAAPTDPAPPPTIAVKRFELLGGQCRLVDYSITPFVQNTLELAGTVEGLSSRPADRATVALTGTLDQGAPIKISGQIAPLQAAAFIDLNLEARRLDLTAATPYSQKYTGYPVQKGKLNLTLDVNLAERKLESTNNIRIDQLELGRYVSGPDATSLPVKMALALLQDRSGNIDIDLPVSGDMSDPDVSAGDLVLDALTNLVTKTAASPFDLLAQTVGGGGALDRVNFQPGEATISEPEIEKLMTLARALAEKTQLAVEIKGVAHRREDARILKDQLLNEQIKRQWLAGRPASEKATPLAQVELNPNTYRDLLFERYEKEFGQAPALMASDESAAITEDEKKRRLIQSTTERLLETIELEEGQLRNLGRDRARNIRTALLAGGVEEDRLFVLESEIIDTAGESVDLLLALTPH